MDTENPIDRFESKLDAQGADLRSFNWFIGPVIVFTVLVIALVQLLFAARGPGKLRTPSEKGSVPWQR